MKGPPLGPCGEDITWPDQVAPRGRKSSTTRNLKSQTSNLLQYPEVAQLSRSSTSSTEDVLVGPATLILSSPIFFWFDGGHWSLTRREPAFLEGVFTQNPNIL